MPYKHIANSWQGSIRLMWRIGGKSLKSQTKFNMWKNHRKSYRKTYNHETNCRNSKPNNVLCDLFNNIYFEFDKTEITPKAAYYH